MSRHPRRLPAVVGPVLVLVLATSGCTASAPGSGRPAAVVASAAAQDPVELIGEARSGLEEVLAYHVTGSLTLAGREVAVDLTVAYSGGHGTFTADGGAPVTLDFVAVNPLPGSSGLFITAPARYWTSTGASDADAGRYADRQVSVPDGSDYTTLSQLLSQKGLTQLVFLTAGTVDTPHVLASPAVDGQPAWIVDFGGDHTTRLTMMQNGQQFPLRLDSPRAHLTFGQFGKEPRVDSPATILLTLPG